MVPGDHLAPYHQTPLEAVSDCFLAARLLEHKSVLGTVLRLFEILLVGVVSVTLFGKRDQIGERQGR